MASLASTFKKIDLAVVTIAGGMILTLVLFFYFMQKDGIKRDPKYIEVSSQVGPQFDKISSYLDTVKRHYKSAGEIPQSEARNAADRRAGKFHFQMKNMGVYNGEFGYCLVAEHINNNGRAYYSSIPVTDPTWEGNRSYHHYVTGQEPAPDLTGPCNEQVIRGSR